MLLLLLSLFLLCIALSLALAVALALLVFLLCLSYGNVVDIVLIIGSFRPLRWGLTGLLDPKIIMVY